MLTKFLNIIKPSAKVPTFKEYGKYILEITNQNRNKFSQKEELQRFKTLCKTFGDMQVTEIKPSLIQQWQNDSTFSAKTIMGYRSTLNIILKMAYHDELINRNPMEVVKAPRVKKKRVQVFTMDEVKLLISESKGQFSNILRFNFFQGLRGSELISLKWSNIDFENNLITVSTRIRQGDEDETKSKQTRVIDLLPPARKALINQYELIDEDDYIFKTQYGEPYKTPETLTVQLKRLCKKVGIEERTFHVTRKTCNTMYKQLGFNQDWILHQMGHVDNEVNHTHYTGKIKIDFYENALISGF